MPKFPNVRVCWECRKLNTIGGPCPVCSKPMEKATVEIALPPPLRGVEVVGNMESDGREVRGRAYPLGDTKE